jgi:hypothetical protein
MGTLSFAIGGQTYLNYLFRATNGGTTFSTITVTGATDLFEDSPTVNDAIYFGIHPYYMFGKINFDISTALVGTDVVLAWEYYGRNEDGVTFSWRELPAQKDDTNGFTTTGANAFWTGLPYNAYPPSVNGVTAYYFVRCRLVSFTSISEGGRTNSVLPRDATLYISGYTDEEPCTLEEIYQYMKTNYPYLTGITKMGGFHNTAYDFATYDFRQINFWTYTRLLVKKEGFHQGCGEVYGASGWCGRSNYSYLTMGEKVGELGKDGGWMINHSLANAFQFTSSSQTKIYNSFMKGKGTGYIAIEGEWYANIISNFNLNPYYASTMNNNIFESSLWLMNGLPNPFSGNKIVFNPRWGFIYNLGFTARDLDWEPTTSTTSVFQFNHSMGHDMDIVFIDPVTPLPLNTSSYPNLLYYPNAGETTFSKVLYNDVSEGTFTDYTTECSDTEHEMPLDGDVGDYYYFAMNGTNGRFGLYLFILANTTNDYEYEWEFYNSIDGWLTSTEVKDTSNNFSQNGQYWPFSETVNTYTSSVVNGLTYIWCRLKIVKKGTGSPKVSRITYGGKGAVGNWTFQMKYTLGLTLTNADGDLIEDASVIIKHDGEEVYSGETDENGQIPNQELIYLKHYLDPVNGTYQNVSTDTYDKYSLEITKQGYEDYSGNIDMSKKQILSIALQRPNTYLYEDLNVAITEDSIVADINEDSLTTEIVEDELSIDIEEE